METLAVALPGVVDGVILAVALIAVVVGLWKGFFGTVKHFVTLMIAGALSVSVYPAVAQLLSGMRWLTTPLTEFFGKNAFIQNLAVQVAQPVQHVLDSAGSFVGSLPQFFTNLVQNAVQTQQFASVADAADYATQTAVMLCVELLAFVLCFAVLSILLSILMHLIRGFFRLPGLKQVDRLIGAAFALVVAYIICTVGFMLLPLMQSLLPNAGIDQAVADSQLAWMFLDNPLARFISGFFSGMLGG